MFQTLALIALFLLPEAAFAQLTIKKLSYDREQDLLIVDTSFPGKCLEHELSLELTKNQEPNYSFQLKLTNNDGQDLCNGLAEKSATFSMAELKRPAEVLVSTEVDGKKPHAIYLPLHDKAQLSNAQFINGLLEIEIIAMGKISSDRFYLSLNPKCETRARCDIYVHDKKNVPGTLKHREKIKLSVSEFKGMTLLFQTQEGQIISVFVP